MDPVELGLWKLVSQKELYLFYDDEKVEALETLGNLVQRFEVELGVDAVMFDRNKSFDLETVRKELDDINGRDAIDVDIGDVTIWIEQYVLAKQQAQLIYLISVFRFEQ